MTRSTRSIAAEQCGWDVDHRDAVEIVHVRRGHDLDLDVEEVHHPLVFRPRDSNAAMMSRLPVAAQHVTKRQPAGKRVGVGSLCKRMRTRSASLKTAGTAEP